MALFKVTFELIQDNRTAGANFIYVSHSSKEKALECATELNEALIQRFAKNITGQCKTIEELPEKTMLYFVGGEAIPAQSERLITLVGEQSTLSNYSERPMQIDLNNFFRYYDSFTENDSLCIVMEYASQGSLYDKI